jgi:hypothetical protein
VPDEVTLEWLQQVVEPFVRDVRATLDREFVVRFARGDDGLMVWAYNSGQTVHDINDAAAQLVNLARNIPDFAFDDVLEPWPRCPRHGDHPLMPQLRRDVAMWCCMRADGGGPVCAIGELASADA